MKMLKLRMNTEDWREQVIGWVADDLDEARTDLAAEAIRGDVLRQLSDAGVEYETAHQQSVGTHVIVQAGTTAERDAFDSALKWAIKSARSATAS